MQAAQSCSHRPRPRRAHCSLVQANYSAWCLRHRTRGHLINRYYDPTTGQFITQDLLVAITGQAYQYAGDDPVNGSDPSGLCVKVFFVCIGGGSETSGISFRFDPGAAANAVVNIGRGASFGLSDQIANWISPGASCTVPQNGVDFAIGAVGTAVATSGLAEGAAAADAGDETEITFGHGARHLIGTGLDEGDVESVITSQVRESISGAQPSGSFWGRVTVDGQTVEYRAFTLSNGTINIGTYYVVP